MYLDYEYYINGICKYNGSDIFVFKILKYYYLVFYCNVVVKGIFDYFIFYFFLVF